MVGKNFGVYPGRVHGDEVGEGIDEKLVAVKAGLVRLPAEVDLDFHLEGEEEGQDFGGDPVELLLPVLEEGVEGEGLQHHQKLTLDLPLEPLIHLQAIAVSLVVQHCEVPEDPALLADVGDDPQGRPGQLQLLLLTLLPTLVLHDILHC